MEKSKGNKIIIEVQKADDKWRFIRTVDGIDWTLKMNQYRYNSPSEAYVAGTTNHDWIENV